MIAVYRNLYLWDYWHSSVQSVRKVVSKVYAVVDTVPWGDVEVTEDAKKAIGKTLEVASAVADVVIHDHVPSPINQFTHVLNDLIPGDEPVMVIEADMVWRQDQLSSALKEAAGHPCSMSRQVEIWKGLRHRVPERPNRTGCVFWFKRPLPATMHQANISGMHVLRAFVHNFGFAVSPATMLVKDQIAKAMSAKIGDCLPNPKWIDRWMDWKPGDKDLEISAGYEHDIPEAVPYPQEELPCLN